MDILVVHTAQQRKDRKTLTDSLYCFGRYDKGNQYYYLNVKKPGDVPRFLAKQPFDGVIFHYSFLSNRFGRAFWKAFYPQVSKTLHELSGYKVAIPQDEYGLVGDLCTLIKDSGVRHIFTCALPEDYDKIYPKERTGGAGCSTVYTGYIDDDSRTLLERLAPKVPQRSIGIGYRARKNPAYVGSFSLIKTELARQVTAALENHSGITADISTTGNTANAFLGDDWFRFLLRCRTMLGCLSGSSMLDVDGSIYDAVSAYEAAHPHATFTEVEAACFAGRDDTLNLKVLSPRNFECALSKTCQVLVEGDYGGVFKPGLHYIELKADYSNLDDVLRQVEDEAHCARIALRCYDDIAAVEGPKNPNTYAWFAQHVAGHIAQNRPAGAKGLGLWGRLRCRWWCGYVKHKNSMALVVYNRALVVYNYMSRFLEKRPAAKRLAQRLFGKSFEVEG